MHVLPHIEGALYTSNGSDTSFTRNNQIVNSERVTTTHMAYIVL